LTERASIEALIERASIGDSIGASTERASIGALIERALIGPWTERAFGLKGHLIHAQYLRGPDLSPILLTVAL
jgi:hypothetical protein